jgi:CRP-like cAMP-binding protein
MTDSASNFDKPVKFKNGQVVFAEGEASSFLYLVVSGRVQILKDEKGKLVPISSIGPQDFIGELSMFSDEARSASAIAVEDSELMVIKKSDIRKVLRSCPDWVSNIMMTISDRLRSTVDVLTEHRIIDDLSPNSGSQVTDKDLSEFQGSLKAYRGRRGI